MRKISFVLAAVALTASAGQAHAQNLSWYGMTACFGTSTYSYDNGGHKSSNTSCAANLGTVTNSWGNSSNTSKRSSVSFARLSVPGGPGDQGSGDPMSLTFGGVNSWNTFLLGTVTYKNGDIATTSGNSILSSTIFNMQMFFDGSNTSTFDYYNEVKVTNNENGGTDNVNWGYNDATPWKTFSVGGHNYEFRIAGLDFTSQDKCEDLSDLDFLPQSMEASSGGTKTAALCGKIYYRGTSVVPEPSTYLLMTAGLVGIGAVARRRRNA